MNKALFNVSGMHCSSCSMLISMELSDLAGVSDVDCDHATGRTEVTYDPSQVSPVEIVSAITAAGYAVDSAGQ